MKNKKRRDNMLYKLRRHGIRADIKEKVIFIPTKAIRGNFHKCADCTMSSISTFNLSLSKKI